MNIIHKLLHPCQRVDELLSQSMDEPLGWLDRMRMGIHVRMCGPCQEVGHQMETLHKMGGDLGDEKFFDNDLDLMDELPTAPPRKPGT